TAIEQNYQNFFQGVTEETKKTEIASVMLFNQSLFPFCHSQSDQLNSSIADILTEFYADAETKRRIDNQINKLIKFLGQQEQKSFQGRTEIWTLGQKINEIKTNLAQKEGEIAEKEQKIKDLEETLEEAEEKIDRT